MVGCCFSVPGLLFLGVGFGLSPSSSVSVSNYISRLLFFFSGVIQCDRDDGYHHDAKH